MGSFDELLKRVDDRGLREALAHSYRQATSGQRFGLVFERHLPETVRLYKLALRRGMKAGWRDGRDQSIFQVGAVGPEGGTAALLRLTDESGVRLAQDDSRYAGEDLSGVSLGELVVAAEFGDPIYPGLKQLGSIDRGGDAPSHVVVCGENFHALEALQFTHASEVDCIYIDPPYNTGNQGWIYNDRYVADEDAFKHSKWLAFMERRLLKAKDLLKPTGIIIVAIGDNEHHRLRMLMDQVFGPQNFISDIVWQGGRKNDSRYVSNAADYMLVYARDESSLAARETRWREEKPGAHEALEASEAIWAEAGGDHQKALKRWRAWMREFKKRGVASDAVTRFVNLSPTGEPIRTDGDLRSPNPRKNLRYDLLHPVTGRPVKMHPNGWRFSQEVMLDRVARGLVHFGADETSGAGAVAFLRDLDQQVADSVFVRDRNPSGKQLDAVLGERRFPNPKDVNVLMRWMRLVAPDDAVVVDFFAGSGTAAEAVMRLNAEDGGRRHCILVTNNEVAAMEAKALKAAGHGPGDDEWEAKGVFRWVTRPRLETVVTGVRPDGSSYSDGLAANVEYLELTYHDPAAIELDTQFNAIAPLLWMRAGGVGPVITDERDGRGRKPYAWTEGYGVLFNPDRWTGFVEKLPEAATTAFVVTDSPSTFARVRGELPGHLDVVRLYERYLTTFAINAGSEE